MISGTRFRLDLEITRQSRLAKEIARAQAEIATGKRILAPSDDAAGFARVSELERAEGKEATWLRNIDTASALAARSDTILTSAANSVDRAKELMLRAASGTLSASDRSIIANELRAIAEEITALRETRDPRGEPLFRTNGELEVPVSAGVRVAPVATRASIFDSPADIVAIVNAAAAAAEEADPATRAAATRTSLADLDEAIDQIASARQDQGVRAGRLDKLRDALKDSGLQLIEQRTAIEGADITEVIARIESKTLNLKAAQAIFARVNQTSLFDLIR
ncbi:MAG: flagellin-like protein [Pseudomonadota bacterium]|nr:flagellin-like protein [Pseudomonadota bacterium]